MRRMSFGNPPTSTLTASPEMKFVYQALREIEKASLIGDAGEAADGFTLATFTVTRTLDPATATVGDVANVLATFLSDLQKRGSKRT